MGRIAPKRRGFDFWLPSAVRRPPSADLPSHNQAESGAMNIAVVCPYALDRFGGVQAQTIGLVERLRGEGHAAWLVAPGRTGPERARLVGSTITVPANRSSVPVALGPGVPGRVRRAISGADLVHVHEPLMPLVSWSALAATVPVVGTFHADPSNLIRRSYRVAGPVLGIRRRLAAVTAVSRVAAAAVEPLFDEVIVIPNAVEVETVPEVDRVATRVAFVGRDDARKGLDVLLEAWPGVVAAVAGRRVGGDRDR